MADVVQSDEFIEWLSDLRDRAGRDRVLVRLDRLANGNPGDVKPVGDGLSELRITFGPGYRVYFTRIGDTIIVILAGGDKSTQAQDIERAKRIATRWRA